MPEVGEFRERTLALAVEVEDAIPFEFASELSKSMARATFFAPVDHVAAIKGWSELIGMGHDMGLILKSHSEDPYEILFDGPSKIDLLQLRTVGRILEDLHAPRRILAVGAASDRVGDKKSIALMKMALQNLYAIGVGDFDEFDAIGITTSSFSKAVMTDPVHMKIHGSEFAEIWDGREARVPWQDGNDLCGRLHIWIDPVSWNTSWRTWAQDGWSVTPF